MRVFCCILQKVKISSFLRNFVTKRRYSKNLKDEPPWKILFFGTDEFSLQSLKALCAKLNTGTLIESLGVVSKRDSVVEKFGKAEGLPSYIWPLKATDIKGKYDIGMVVSFGNLIPNDIIQSLPLGCINIHASILPRWRGAAPIIHAIMNGDTETGITVMKIHPHRFDVGEIIRQYRIPIKKNETAVQLGTTLARCGSHLLIECLRDLPRCLEMAIPQPEIGISYAPKVHLEMSLVNWDGMSARAIFNLHRALYHLYPLYTKWHGSVVKLTDISLDESSIKLSSINESTKTIDLQKNALDFLSASDDDNKKLCSANLSITNNLIRPGSFQFFKKRRELQITCSDGNNIIVNKLKLGKLISASDFYNGFLTKRPKTEWFFET